MNLYCLTAGLTLAASLIFAPRVSAQSLCETIIRTVNYNQRTSVQKENQSSLNRANLCLAEYSSASKGQKAQIEASYEAFSGKARGSTQQVVQKQKQMCDEKYGEYWFSEQGLDDQKNVSDLAIDAVNKCLEALSKGLLADAVYTEEDAIIAFSVEWKGTEPILFRGVWVSPSNELACKIEGKDIDQTNGFTDRKLAPNQPQAILCSRAYRKENVQGEDVECLPPAMAIIETAGGIIRVPFFRRCKTDFLVSRAREITQRTDAMDERIGAVEGRLGTIEDGHNTLRNEHDVLNAKAVKDVRLSGQKATGFVKKYNDWRGCQKNPLGVVAGVMSGDNYGAYDMNLLCRNLEVVR